jgi:hypothetical protein
MKSFYYATLFERPTILLLPENCDFYGVLHAAHSSANYNKRDGVNSACVDA